MKKTKYIGIAYLMFITSAILITYIDAKAHGKPSYEKRFYAKKVSKPINNFKVLVTAKNTNIAIVKDTINLLYEVYYVRKDNQQKDTFAFGKSINYSQHGDTLFINNTHKKTLNISAKDITQIIAKEKSKINISKFYAKQLKIESKRSKINGKNNNIKHLNITASHRSDINFNNSKIDTLKIFANNSKIYNSRNKTNILEAKLIDSSYLRASETSMLNVITDKTSRYRIEGK